VSTVTIDPKAFRVAFDRFQELITDQFINNFWKGDSDNEEFRRLLMLVRGVEAA
jgi:hypothetical protein